ncbi:trypsin-like peptidase domain-containing protein [Patescibacteria group bacterium AH-259-L05]|nr:trypsin-like peptidase domain-containing protein [Patescibacteria group bacterium AH-259-L05]
MKKPNTKWQKSLITVAVISLLVGTLSGTIAGFYAANLVARGDTPFLYSLLYQKLFRPSEIVEVDKGPVETIREAPSPDSRLPAGSRESVVREVVDNETNVVEVVEQASPSVVSIVVSKYVSRYYSTFPQSPYDDFFEEFFGPWPFERAPAPQEEKQKQEVGGGTGFVISSKDKLILTNKHVVSDEEAEYTVVTNEGDTYEAKVLARDPFNDIAVLKINSEEFNLDEMVLGNSDNLKIGQSVIAIGNALGEYRNTVTKGVISGIGRRVVAGDAMGQSVVLENVIQTDAAINFGNSGGPLINLSGEVIGINTAISRAGQLIGFAIPINQAKVVVESIKKYGKIVRPFLGVRYVLINEKIAKANNLDIDYGALIVKGSRIEDLAVIPGAPADKAGLVENDIILEVNGAKITESSSLAKQIQKYEPGDEITLKILHDGEEKTVTATLEEYKEK